MNSAAQFDEPLSDLQTAQEDRPVPCSRRIGAAGTGKTFSLLRDVGLDPSFGLLTSTTGISAVNLGAITVHSTLRYSTTDVLRDIFLSGRLQRTLHGIAVKYRRLIVEEYSMSDADQLDIWYRGVQEANRYADVKEPLGIMLVGDLAQLPPVNAKWCFEASCWGRFADNTERLDRVYRQEGGNFLDALNCLRKGEGGYAMELLSQAGAQWNTIVDTEFEGTTILPKNKMVDRYNALGLDRIKQPPIMVRKREWGKTRKEWENIPSELTLKVGAYVMVLSNARDFSFVNGDCGHVVDYHADADCFIIQLVRTQQPIAIPRIVRSCDQADEPEGWSGDRLMGDDDDGRWYPKPHLRAKSKRYVLGQVEYFPLRLAYASTVHKSQSLTLDRVQVDYRDWFFGKPAMLYVALSRCRTLEGLRLVGMREKFVKQCSIDGRVLPWL